MGNVLKLFREKGAGDTFLVVQACPIEDLNTPKEKWFPSCLAMSRRDSPENESKAIDDAIKLVLDQSINLNNAVSKFAYRVVRALPLEVTADHKLVETGAEIVGEGSTKLPLGFRVADKRHALPPAPETVTFCRIQGNINRPEEITKTEVVGEVAA